MIRKMLFYLSICIVPLLVLGLVSASVISSRPDHGSAVANAPDTKVGWAKVIFLPSQYGTAQMVNAQGPDVESLVPSFGQAFQIIMHKSAHQNSYCHKPPCYISKGFQVSLAFTPSRRYQNLYKSRDVTVMCSGSWYVGSNEHPVVHSVGIQKYQNKLHFFCS